MRKTVPGAVVVLLALPLLLPAAADAQKVLRGVVRDSLGLGIAGVQVSLGSGGLRAETGADGRFAFPQARSADEEVQFRRLGYRPERRLWSPSDAAPELMVELSALPQRLAPVIVSGRENLRGNALGFYRRMDQGQGRFVTAEQIERRSIFTMRDLFRTVPGMRTETMRGRTYVRLRGSSVPPMVFLDGVRMAAGEIDIELLDPQTFLGVEVYSGDATMPPEFNQVGLSGQRGGAIVIWTREGQIRPRLERRGRNERSAASTVSAMVEREEVFTEDQVDTPARPDPSLPIEPMYPDSLFSAGVTGFALAEFVVMADGQVQSSTLDIVTATHPLFGDAVRRALVTARFFPATRQGRRVAQVVQLPIRFTLPERNNGAP
ncbi:TonB family protein [Pseudogemmatithrix spongiicola]|uniref:TonB family protein n=1 Tax=Pseudogemmatithrix spongiicola TaxID=3062599 RepID=A0AA49K056_9BACT|nr:TonB family protein [Gemmatimonadaceae bacterium 'strain 138']WKW15264.1 TonB family protein [Gemmatimonadaceae bacterium 'strain 318']